ncbi:hypothetical protein AEGHOMDF_5953 [Methylobacterium soli]|nr:hypothetical protein AEGHOMDF_5953 [Methylobacterium soli]
MAGLGAAMPGLKRPDRLGGGAGRDQNGPIPEALRRPGEGALDRGLAGQDPLRVEAQHRHMRLCRLDLAEGRLRATAREAGGVAADSLARQRIGGGGAAPGRDQGAAEAEAEAGGPDREGVGEGRVAEDLEIGFEDRVGDGGAVSGLREGVEARGDRGNAAGYRREIDEADGGGGLSGEDAHEVGVPHRVEGMVLERTLVEGHGAHEEVALVDGAPGLREGRRDEGDRGAGGGPEGIEDRTDIARIGRIEGGADLEQDMGRAAFAQPAFGGQGALDGLPRRDRPALQRHHHGVDLRQGEIGIRHPDGLDGAQARLGQGVGEVGGARVIVGDRSEGEGTRAHWAVPPSR